MPFAKIPFAKDDDNSEMKEYDFMNTKKFSENYKRHFGNQKMRSYEDIVTEYGVDLEILLRKETYDEFNRKQREKVVNQAVIREIENVLKTIDEI